MGRDPPGPGLSAGREAGDLRSEVIGDVGPRRDQVTLVMLVVAMVAVRLLPLLPGPTRLAWFVVIAVAGVWMWRARVGTRAVTAVALGSMALAGVDVSHEGDSLGNLGAEESPMVVALLVMAIDQTRRLRHAGAALQRLVERERRFLRNASHELRTPLTAALGHAELIHRSAPDSQTAEDAGVVVDELMRMRTLLERLQLLVSLEQTGSSRAAPVDLATLARERWERWAGVPRHWIVHELEDVQVRGDSEALSLALDALLENAVRHTSSTDVVEVSIRRDGRLARLAVSNSGPAIPIDDPERLFEPLSRLDDGRARRDGGAGLGLSIVKAVAEAHGGTAQVRPGPRGGSRFELALPVVR